MGDLDLDLSLEDEGPGERDCFAWMRDYRYLRWDELPEEPIYLRELVDRINERHKGFPMVRPGTDCFTVAMARNYIKAGLTPQPIGKRYGREHWCRLYLASVLKSVYDASHVQYFCELLLPEDDMPAMNDAIAVQVEVSFAAILGCTPAEPVVEDELTDVRRFVGDALSNKAASLCLAEERMGLR